VSILPWVAAAAAILSGFFALTGQALRSFRRAEFEELMDEASAESFLRRLDRHIKSLKLTTSLCRSLANLALVVSLIEWFDSDSWASVTGAVALAGVIIAIVGVAIPQAWAHYGGEKVLSHTLGVLLGFRYLLYPLIALMQAFDLPVRRLSGVSDEEHHNGEATRQEILQAASEGQAEGSMDAEEVEMIESVIEFSETQAGEIMTPRTDIFAVPVGLSWQEAARQIVDSGHSRVPVYGDDLDDIIGILYAKDLLRLADSPAEQRSIRDVMRKCFFVPETKTLDDLLREFKARKVHIAVLLDEYGGTAGLVTIEDVLEEIVGEIADEYDRAEPLEYKQIGPDLWEVEGRMHIDELNDMADLEIPEDEDFDTVAGFVFSELGYIPAVGEKLETTEARFTVLAADERKISRLKVEALRPAGESNQ
jgi:CBS domain containing-hemolysin-like protein